MSRFGMLLFMGLMVGCGNQSQQMFRAATGLEPIQTVAVLPFENLTQDNHAGEVMTELFATEVFRAGRFKLMRTAEVVKLLNDKGETIPTKWDRLAAARVAQLLNLDAVFYGSVLEYTYLREIREGEVVAREPAVGLQARLLERKNRQIVWVASHSRSSYEMVVSNRESLTMVASKAIETMLGSLWSPKK